MQQKVSVQLLPAEAEDTSLLKIKLASATGKKETEITGFHILKKSIDARGKNIFYNLQVQVFINEPCQPLLSKPFVFRDVRNASKKVVIIGAGPAGLFAALYLLEAGIKPIILERGKDVRARRRDLALLNKEGIIDPDSNYCFGEGGAGTYSDGKLYTRSNKRGDINRILQLFVHFGAEENILFDAHPHIGTNKLPRIITAMRQQIVDCGGIVEFEKKVTDLTIHNGQLVSVTTSKNEFYTGDAFILATGHSARDIFELLHRKGLLLEAKPIALGVRVEHPQSLIDSIQYHAPLPAKSAFVRDENLPPASYSLANQVQGKGVFSFCMCPGGIIAPASTSAGELVVNGWSPSKRNNPFANSGIVAEVKSADAFKALSHLKIKEDDPFLFLHFQKMVEQFSYEAGGGNFVAPAQRMVDFCSNKISASLPANSYLPGLKSAELKTVLPSFIYEILQKGFMGFGIKMKGYFTNEAIIVATESRTSSPIKIPRDANSLMHPQLEDLYPCGEGAGYAGGIVSAAMDGENVAAIITKRLLHL
ncbi:MAG: FAD-dependent protein [Ferruginibacter sp.]